MFRLLEARAKGLAVVFLMLVGVSQGFGYNEGFETVDLRVSPFYLNRGETKTIQIDRDWHYVQKVYVQAIGSSSDGTFEVITNGDVKGTIHVPAYDPSYVVTIGESVNSLQFRHVTGSRVYIQNVKVVRALRPTPAVIYPYPYPHPEPLPFPAFNEASGLSREAIRLIDLLEPYASYAEYGQFLLPIKKAGARAYAAAQATGSLSKNVRDLLIALTQQIKYATPYVEVTFERENAFELAVALKSLGDRLEHMLR